MARHTHWAVAAGVAALTLPALLLEAPSPPKPPIAQIRLRWPTSFADVEGGLPGVFDWQHRPVVGTRTGIKWTTNWAPPRPNVNTALLVTLREPPQAQPIPGGRGGMLQVPPDIVLTPRRPREVESDGMLAVQFDQDEDGVIALWVNWPRAWLGLRVWCQLLVEDARVPAGCVPTPMIEMVIGTP